MGGGGGGTGYVHGQDLWKMMSFIGPSDLEMPMHKLDVAAGTPKKAFANRKNRRDFSRSYFGIPCAGATLCMYIS